MASAATSASAGTTQFDWATAVRPLLAATYGNFQANDLIKLAKCIEASRDQIMNHEPEFEPFYSLFVALATHHLCSNAASVPRVNLQTVTNACRVLAEFILDRLANPHAQCSVAPKQFVLLVKSLSKGLGFLQRADVITLAALMKSSQLPPHIRATIGAEKLAEEEPSQKGRRKDRTAAGLPPTPTRSASVLPSLIDILSVPVQPSLSTEKGKDVSKPSTPTDGSKDVKDQFVSECMQHLLRLNAGSILIDVCLKLPFLARYTLMYRDLMRGESPFETMNTNECQSIFDSYSSFLNDVVMVSRVVVLPLLEPLTPERLTKLCSLGCTCLLAACTVVTAYHAREPKADPDAATAQELEAFTNSVVEKSLVIFSTIVSNIKNSQSVGIAQLQNIRALGACCLSEALSHMLEAFSVNGAIICIAQQLLSLLEPLLADLKSDATKLEIVTEFNPMSVLTPWQRFEYINEHCKLLRVLVAVVHDSFSRGLELLSETRSALKPSLSETIGGCKFIDSSGETDGSQVQSIPNTPSESDSEPLLGSWLEELLSSVPQLVDSAVKQSAGILHGGLRRRTTAASDSSSLGIREDAQSYMLLAINCLRMLSDNLLTGYRTDVLKESVSSNWTDREIGHLATLIRKADAQNEARYTADETLVEFKSALTKFVHNLIANNLLGESLETRLLAKLDIGVGAEDIECAWPLTLSPLLAGVLCQVLLLRQNKDRDESGRSETGTAIINIWRRFLATLKKSTFQEHDFIDVTDVNVEHLQVLISLFHSLPLMQKKAILLDICKTLKEILDENKTTRFLNNNVSPHFARLVLIFEYMLRFFYDPPPALLQQLKRNVFSIQSRATSDDSDDVGSLSSHSDARTVAMHFSCEEIEEIYRAEVPTMQQVKLKPFFYNLAPTFSTQEVPKLDGLAATFIQVSFNYNEFYASCCEMTCYFDSFRPSLDESAPFQRAVLRYCCSLVWRILKLLPPSVGFLEHVLSWTPDAVSNVPATEARVFLLSTGMRLSEAAFAGWVKDGLIKQGRNAEQVDDLMKKLANKNNDAEFILRLVDENIEKVRREWRVDSMASNGPRFPSFTDIVYTDMLLCRAYSLLDSEEPLERKKRTEIVPLTRFKAVLNDCMTAAHTLVLERVTQSPNDPFPSSGTAQKAALKLMSLCGSSPHQCSEVATLCWHHLHPTLKNAVEYWNRRNLSEFPAAGAWRNEFSQDISPVDSYLNAVYIGHIGSLSNDWFSSQFITFKRILHTSFHLLADVISWYPNAMPKKEVDQLVVPVLYDVLSSHLSDYAFSVLTNVHGAQEHDILQETLYRNAIPTAYEIIVEYTLANDGAFEAKVSEKCLQLMESALEVSGGRKALIYVLTSVGNIGSLLRVAVHSAPSLGFTTALVRFFGKIFQTAELVIHEKEFTEFCHSISKSFSFEPQLLQQLLNGIFVITDQSDDSVPNRLAVMMECCTFLEAVARSANRASSCDGVEMGRLLLQHLIPVMTTVLTSTYQFNVSEDSGIHGPFTQLFYTLTRFASVGRGLGHLDLLKAVDEWVTLCTTRVSCDDALAQIRDGEGDSNLRILSESMSTILNYLSDLINLLDRRQSEAVTGTYDSDFSSGEQEMDGLEDVATQAEDEESGAEDSDEDALDSKLCTFTVTQKEFMNQHWYHCHTCGMVNGEGVCNVCAKVCHKGHDLSYSKYGSFFCDCGAKSEPSCQALVKRTKSKSATKTMPIAADETAVEVLTDALAAFAPAQSTSGEKWRKPKVETKKLVQFYGDNRDREELRKYVDAAKAGIVKNLLGFLEKIVPAVSTAAESNSSIGCFEKLRESLTELQECEEFRCDTVETIAKVTGGSQENTFENVNIKASFAGDQGQTIKQLLMNHVLHRICLACPSSLNRRKQFLVVAHDRCKVAVMHLSNFLKQVENGKKKPALTRCASETFPFTILSVAENPLCEDYFAICGLKECVVVTLASTGTITDRLTLTVSMDVGNFVIKALWLPDSCTEIALVTADFVRIYDLAKSATRPEYDFLLPAGKIRDATFVCRETKSDGQHKLDRYLLLMTSSGYIYSQQLGSHCHNLLHGSLFITDVLEIRHDDLEEANGNISGGGVSVYYSHNLQRLFASYSSGKNVTGSLSFPASGLGALRKVQFITWKSSQKSVALQPLYRWSEMPGHAGVLVALTHANQSPVVMFMRPRSILVQEIAVPPKSKVLDAVLCRNSNSSENSTCILLLCEDGGVRTVTINKDLTNFWTKKASSFQFPVISTQFRSRSKRAGRQDRTDVSEFPVDFFEQCQELTDIEFGGSDLLQLYNTLQLRNRLQTNNLYVACGKTGGFQMEVLNRESGIVICGVRMELGKRSVEKSPSYIEVMGRRKAISLTHARWFDLPFSKEESISTGNKLTITFGPTTDSSGVIIVDSVKVYGKSKEAFGWSDDIEEDLLAMPVVPESRATVLQASMSASDEPQQLPQRASPPRMREIGQFELLVKSAFETLAAVFVSFSDLEAFRETTNSLAISTLTSAVHPDTIRSAKTILRLQAASKTEYYAIKDSSILKYVAGCLHGPKAEADSELFAFLVSLARSVSASRPQSLKVVAGNDSARSLLVQLPDTFWQLLSQVSPHPLICPIGCVEIENLDGLVHAVNLNIAVACRQAICFIYRQKLKKKRFLSSSSPSKPSGPSKPADGAAAASGQRPAHSQRSRSMLQQQQQMNPEQPAFLLMDEPLEGLGPNAMLGEDDADPDGVDQVYEMHADGDEEAMMELAIALSLQDQANVGAAQEIPNVQEGGNYQPVSVQESIDGGHTSDTTGSGLSDEEGSTAATEGSTVHISPSEEKPTTQSTTRGTYESGASGAESGSGRSSNDGERSQGQGTSGAPGLTQKAKEGENKDSKLLLAFLDCLIEAMPRLDGLNGIRCISYMQVVMSLLSSLGCTDAAERKLVMKLLDAVTSGLDFSTEGAVSFCQRSPQSEVILLKLRFITVLLSRSKGRTKEQMTEADAFICSYTAGALLKRGILDYCLTVLKTLLRTSQPADTATSTQKVLPLRPAGNSPDLAPFFLRPYVKEHSRDVFESYTQLVTEMVMRLPYQVKKVADMCRGPVATPNFEPAWTSVLCEFLRSEQSSFVKKHIRKLFMFICGSKEKYRQMRDIHSLEFDLKFVQSLCSPSGVGSETRRHLTLDYGTLNIVTDHLKCCCDIALNRTGNWQKFCVVNSDMFCYLIHLALIVDDNIAATVLTLLNAAVNLPEGKDKAKGEPKREEGEKLQFSGKRAATLGEWLLSEKYLPLLVACLRRYLFECNMSDRRWQMHGFVKALFGCIETEAKQRFLDVLWRDLWPDVPLHGRKAVQFVDILGYFTITSATPQRIASCAANVLKLLKTQNHMLSLHTNANVYNALASLLEFDGYYLESNPCLVCNNPEVPMTSLKLSTVKMDARFTTNSQILKLVSSHEISKITLKISEVRRTKMVKVLSLYYSNKSLQSAVELKNRPDLWILAKRFTLSQNQQELKMEFAVPIVACNLVMEYTDFYESPLTASEMMHCPRCSASVPAHPGVCNNCGENVYQCHKCRAINYDERDPFLCNACGYSKYGKFEYTLTARPVAGVEPIENEEDRKKACNLINTLLEKADQNYRQLQTNRQQIETALGRISGQDLNAEESASASPLAVNASAGQIAASSAMTFVTKNIQQVALKYNRDCRTSFDELSKVVQKIIANRLELVEYDRRVRERLGLPPGTDKIRLLQSSPKCFGCAAATAQHCILLIRGMTASSSATTKLITSQKELMMELIDVAVKQTSARARQSARELLCSIINDQEEATDMVCRHITEKVTRALEEPNWSTAVVTSLVQVELHLLAASLQLMDKCWEKRLRCALDLFVKSTMSPSSAIVEAIATPLLQILQMIIFPPPLLSEKMKGKSLSDVASVSPAVTDLRVAMLPWLTGTNADSGSSCLSYSEWQTGKKPSVSSNAAPRSAEITSQESWLEKALFCPNSVQLRSTGAAIFKQICATAPMRKALVLDLLTKHLNQISELGDRALEFVTLYQTLIDEEEWKVYVSMHGILPQISSLILKEIGTLSALEHSTLATDIAQGYTIKVLTDMLISIVEIEKVRKRWKSQLLSPVLHSYLAVRSIVVQRTKLIDDAQAKLLELLELLTTGTDKETKEFMLICVETVKRSPLDDLRTPVFIFERLCSMIYPEEKEVGEFLINIEKDPAQEDFLQGRMAGNPYNSNDSGMGPLMRDIKNKICRDCELLSLLEDDTGMELLVNGKIISLDLPVVDVYKKVWQPQHNGEAMMVVYRMRGLLGDATEEFIENLAPKKGEKINEEEVFRLAGVMSECGGLQVMIDKLASVKNVTHASPLLSVLLTLFEYCVKVKRNRTKLIEPGLKAFPKFLTCLKLIVSTKDTAALPFAEKMFSILDRLISEANELPETEFKALFGESDTNSGFEYLLNLVLDDQSNFVGSLKESLLRTLPNLTLGSEARMKLFVDYFKPHINFESYDSDPTAKASLALDSFCIAAKGVIDTKYGHELKNRFIQARFLETATKYLIDNCPPLFKVGVTMDSPDWKEFLSRPSLKYILRLLAGISRGYEEAQVAIAKECIPVIHRLEQVSSEEHLGTLAEAVMEALRENPSVAKRIIEVREETRAKKKQMAMAMRKNQLAQMGMKIGEKGLVRVESGVLKDANLHEETGLVCSICQEGYTAAPQKVLGIYTYSKRVNCDDYETKQRKTPAYSTVTHFNVIHVDCHQTAVRSARGRDEWESAMLHNANTRCNGLLPFWGPNVSESEYAGHLSKHNQYIQEHTGVTDIGFASSVHDLKLLLNRFANEKSFADETGGGGRSSNIHLIPYLLQVSTYFTISSNQLQNQTKALQTYMALRPTDWVALAFESESHLYYCVLAFLLSPPSEWQKIRLDLLKRLIVTAQGRQIARAGATKSLPDTAVKDYLVYKPYFIFLALVNGFYNLLFSEVKCDSPADWPAALQLYIRQNDSKLLESTTKLLKFFEEDLLPCESFGEVLEVCGLLTEIENPDEFLAATLASVS